MAITKLDKDMDIIQKLGDEPNDVDGLSSADLKAKFDEGNNAIKEWINESFIPDVERELEIAIRDSVPEHAGKHSIGGDDPLTPADIGAESKASYVTADMTASGWSGNTYSFEAAYPKKSFDISIEVAPTATAEQFEAFGGAMICGSADSNIATALGDVPTVDIPIIIKVVAK